MNSAGSVLQGAFSVSGPVQLVAVALPVLLAVALALAVARILRGRRLRGASPPPAAQPRWPARLREALRLLAPLLAALALLLAGHAALAALGYGTALTDSAVQVVAALVLVRLGVHVLGRALGPLSWVRSRELAISVILSVIAAVALLGWLDAIEAALNRISLVPGKTQ